MAKTKQPEPVSNLTNDDLQVLQVFAGEQQRAMDAVNTASAAQKILVRHLMQKYSLDSQDTVDTDTGKITRTVSQK